MSEIIDQTNHYLDRRIGDLTRTIREAEYELRLVRMLKHQAVQLYCLEPKICEANHLNDTINITKLLPLFEEPPKAREEKT